MGGNGKGWIGVAKVPPQAGRVLAIQVYYDGINDKKVVLQCSEGNFVYDADLNCIVPLLGKNSKVIVRDGKIIKL